MGLKDGIKNAVRNFLDIREPAGLNITIDQLYTHEAEVFRNRVWYRGQADELSAFYDQVRSETQTKSRYFWGSRPTMGANIRKLHTGLPALIVDTLADISVDDLDKIEVGNRQTDWDNIADDNNIEALLKSAVVDVLWSGDGAFKWSVDPAVSEYPIIEFFDASRVEYEIDRGRLNAIIFKTKKQYRNHCYTLKERYDKHGITYMLCDDSGRDINMQQFPELADLAPIVNKGEFMMALPLSFRKSKRFDGRGKSIFDGKIDSFDSFDEVWSQWMLALRKGQIKTYIPDVLMPRNPKTGEILRLSDFDNDFIATGSDMGEGKNNTITHTQGDIQYAALLQTYTTALDLCLQGVMSPSTLGIDMKKLDNAESQREKEKTTLYRRNQIVNVLEETIKDIVNISLAVYDGMQNKAPKEQEVNVTFGGYASPSFEAQIETVSKAAASGVMSVEAIVEELWGDTRDKAWKAEEIARIKEEKGLLEAEEPAVNMDVPRIGFN